MAKSKYEYVKEFETDDRMLRNVYVLVRIDGKGFHKFSQTHDFAKPNDVRGINLMNHAARCVMHELDDILLAFGESDEYSFLFRKSTDLYQRREAKIVSTVVSLFTSAYVYYWNDYFTDLKRPLYPPVFDGRAVLYPSEVEVKDYFAWRQADTHINNLFNTSFWALVEEGGLTPKAAEARLCGTDSKDKNEMLFTEFNTNYSKLPAMYRKGSVLLREQIPKDADKDAIIPTLPETLPGSKSAKVVPALDTPTTVPGLQRGPDPISESVSEAPSGQSSPIAVDSPVISQKMIMQEGTSASSNEGKKRSIDANEAERLDVEEGPVAKKEAPAFKRMKKGVVIDHIDIIGEKFWTGRGAYILAPEKMKKLRS
ncbi:MAG: tRNAHis guanylyltransferase-domain-containing protein [Linnemannia elongata]|nr:MAG: tRNAHis guanylyltransferase-domain-containing protein [Linnemannia elongata]